MSNSLILFDQELHKQHNRVAKDQCFLFYCDVIWLQNHPFELKPVIYWRYVDDTFLLFRKKYHIEKLCNYLNRQHKKIRFTSETENENSVLFFNIKISRDNINLANSVYRKLIFSGVFTDFESFIPKSYK